MNSNVRCQPSSGAAVALDPLRILKDYSELVWALPFKRAAVALDPLRILKEAYNRAFWRIAARRSRTRSAEDTESFEFRCITLFRTS